MFTKKYTVKKFNITKRQLRVSRRDAEYYLQEALDSYLHLYNNKYKNAELKAEVVSENSIMYKCKVVLYLDDAAAEQLIIDQPEAALEYIL